MSRIEHLVVLVLENRSFDNLLGWLYADQGNRPPLNVPPRDGEPTFDGLSEGGFWNPANEDHLTHGTPPDQRFATRGTSGISPYTVPAPDPKESFTQMTFQQFGTVAPEDQRQASMLGFLVSYARGLPPGAAQHFLESYSPEQVTAISGLAKAFAVSDRWFASVPAQTWPNRAFLHAATAQGHVNNFPYTPYDVKTIYQLLSEHGVSWGIYWQDPLPAIGSLTRLQMRQLRNWDFDRNFRSLETFEAQARDGTLPAYSFLEPAFLGAKATDMHPPHDVFRGEQLLVRLWNALSTGAHWDRTLWVITFDEHGGTFDHVPPPWGALPPDVESNPGELGFRFNRFGVRVPALLVSPYIAPGTVFRSPGNFPFDHTSILATLLDWKGLSRKLLPSHRLHYAPSFADVLTLDTPRTDLPEIAVAHSLRAQVEEALTKALPRPAAGPHPTHDLEKSIEVALAALAVESK